MFEAIGSVFSSSGIFYLLLGACTGFVIGVIPGIGQGTAMILLLPLAFAIPPDKAFILFSSILGATTMGGSVTSILFNTPGSAGNVATILDGYPMARKGEAARALGLAAGASMIGGVLGLIVLAVCIPFVRPLVMAVGVAETFWLIMLAFLVIALASPGGGFLKGLVSIFLGIALSLFGLSQQFGVGRYTFGIMYLWEGIPLVAAIVGLFAMSEFAMLQAKGKPIAQKESISPISIRKVWLSVLEVARYPVTVLRSSIIGAVVGLVPGIGGSIASLLSYGITKAQGKKGLPFGEGNPLGVVAPEAANNAKDGGQMVPLLFFGIPGAPEGALLLMLFIICGISPGPGMALKNISLVYIVIFSIFLGNVIACMIIGWAASRLAYITFIPMGAIFAVVVPITFIACFASRGDFWDIAALALFIVPGVILKRSGYPVIGIIIGYVLGPLLEHGFFTTLESGFFTPARFFSSPLSIGLAVTLALVIIAILVIATLKRFRSRGNDTSRKSISQGELDTAIRQERIGLAMVLLLLSVAFTLFSLQYDIGRAGLFPFIVGLTLILLILVVLTSEAHRGVSRMLQALLGTFGKPGQLRVETGWKPLFSAAGWIFGFICALVALGHLVATLLFVFACMWRVVHMRWQLATIASALTAALIYVAFVVGLDAPLWPGIIPSIVPKVIGGGLIPPL